MFMHGTVTARLRRGAANHSLLGSTTNEAASTGRTTTMEPTILPLSVEVELDHLRTLSDERDDFKGILAWMIYYAALNTLLRF